MIFKLTIVSDILSKFTTHYQKILLAAKQSAALYGQSQIAAADLLIALARERGSIAAEILEKYSLTAKSIQTKLGLAEVDASSSKVIKTEKELELTELLQSQLTPAAKQVVEHSVLVAWRHQHHYVGTEHLLYALVTDDSADIKALWVRLDIALKALKLNVSSVLKSTSKFPDLTESFATLEESDEPAKATATPALDFFSTDLTSAALQTKIDPVIGRDREIQRLINILARRTKNNPLLLGDPGVGKTAIVEGLAKRIYEGRVPDFLQDKKIFSLDLGLTVAGTMYRGEFEGRLKQIMEELKIHPEVILFIDEIHTIVGTGAAPGSLDVANLLKPALAKGLIRCIGATTQEEYKKSIESDAALERRFQVVQVAEPTPDETIAVLRGLRDRYESFHQVRIADEAVEAAVQMSERYLPEKFLPDKAIDLVDEAASHLRTSVQPSAELKQERELESKLKQLQAAKELAIREENFPLATAHKEEGGKAAAELAKLRRGRPSAEPVILGTVGRQQIAEVVSQITGVPLTELLATERTRLANLEATLAKYVIGQSEAITAIAKSVRRARLGLGNPLRPMGSFIFLGPSGVGKTELAKVIAEQVFEDPEALVRLDMSEFSEGFNVSKMIGAPAGYVGYKDSNKLTDLVRRKPYAVVLFDEIEKAHPDVFNLLLQILEDGHLTDAAGKKVNFKNSLILMTSNLGLQELTSQAELGFNSEDKTALQRFVGQYSQTKERLMAEVKKFFRPEFLNRLDGVIVFNPLAETDLESIVKLQIQELNRRFAAQKLGLTVALGRGTARAIARQTFAPEQGARGIRRFLQEQVEDPLTQKLMDNQLKPPAKITINFKDDKLTLV